MKHGRHKKPEKSKGETFIASESIYLYDLKGGILPVSQL